MKDIESSATGSESPTPLERHAYEFAKHLLTDLRDVERERDSLRVVLAQIAYPRQPERDVTWAQNLAHKTLEAESPPDSERTSA